MSCIYKYKGKDYTKDEFYSLVSTTMVQPRTVPKYEKILFPTGNTASKVEGHTTLEEFKKQKEDRLEQLEKRKKKLLITANMWKVTEAGNNDTKVWFDTEQEAKDYIKREEAKDSSRLFHSPLFSGSDYTRDAKELKATNDEINQLKQELERVETEGFAALAPIFKFYEETVTNILINNIYGKESQFVNYEFTFNNDKYERLNDKDKYLKNGEEITQKEFNSIQNSVTKQDKKDGKFKDKHYVNSNAFITDEYGNTWNEVVIDNKPLLLGSEKLKDNINKLPDCI